MTTDNSDNINIFEYLIGITLIISFIVFIILFIKLTFFKRLNANGLTLFLVYFGSFVSGTIMAKIGNGKKLANGLIAGFLVAFFSYPLIMVAILFAGFSTAMPPVFEMFEQTVFLGLACSVFSLIGCYLITGYRKYKDRPST